MVYATDQATGPTTKIKCRSCERGGLAPVLSLGKTPLANALRSGDELAQEESRWPLEVVRCPTCSLVQITETVPPDKLFAHYAYFSSFSDTMVSHARQIVDQVVDRFQLAGESLAIEVASNDGYLLQWYRERGVPVLGIEPAQNIAEVARSERGIPTLAEFFGSEIADRLAAEGTQADVIHANNVLAHVADLNGVVNGFATLLKPNGRVIVEAPYLGDLLEHVEFDTIYHEHLCYFALTPLIHLFARHGLEIVDVEHLEIHGGSLRIYAAHAGTAEPADSVVRLMREESRWVNDPDCYARFAQRVDALRQSLLDCLTELKQAGKRIAVYGASAKGSTMMNYFGIDGDLVEYVVDRSTVKQGFYTPGNQLRIYSPDFLLEDKPDYCLLLTWNFADEIMDQQRAYREQGGKFVVPIPEVRVA